MKPFAAPTPVIEPVIEPTALDVRVRIPAADDDAAHADAAHRARCRRGALARGAGGSGAGVRSGQRVLQAAAGAGRGTLSDMLARIQAGEQKEVAVVVKADVQGSAEAIGVTLGKYWICKRVPNHAYEAMECLGGNGYVEESALPRLIAKMEHAGVEKSTVGVVVPTGYSFNLDGTAIYLTMASLFIAEALGDPAVLVLTSRDDAGAFLGTALSLLSTAALSQAMPRLVVSSKSSFVRSGNSAGAASLRALPDGSSTVPSACLVAPVLAQCAWTADPPTNATSASSTSAA